MLDDNFHGCSCSFIGLKNIQHVVHPVLCSTCSFVTCSYIYNSLSLSIGPLATLPLRFSVFKGLKVYLTLLPWWVPVFEQSKYMYVHWQFQSWRFYTSEGGAKFDPNSG